MRTHRIYSWLALALFVLALALTASGATVKAPRWDAHSAFGAASAALAAFLAVKLRSRAAFSALVFAAAGGLRLAATPPEAWAQIAHALLAQGFLASAFVLSLQTSSAWAVQPHFEDGGFPNLRHLAFLIPPVTLVQIALGAAYRRGAAGLVPHVSWAFATAILVMMAAAFALTQKDTPNLLKRISIWLLALTGMQLLFGVGAYLARQDSPASWLGWMAVAHITTGSLVMALAAGWSCSVWRGARTAGDSRPVELGRHS